MNRRLSEEERAEIRERFNILGESKSEISRDMGISRGTIKTVLEPLWADALKDKKNAYYRKRYRSDPAFREYELSKNRARWNGHGHREPNYIPRT